MNTPKLLPCLECGIKPKLLIFARGYSDKDDEYFRQCPKCKKKSQSVNYLKSESQELASHLAWNKMNISEDSAEKNQ